MTRSAFAKILTPAIIFIALSACGGGSGSPTPTQVNPPPAGQTGTTGGDACTGCPAKQELDALFPVVLGVDGTTESTMPPGVFPKLRLENHQFTFSVVLLESKWKHFVHIDDASGSRISTTAINGPIALMEGDDGSFGRFFETALTVSDPGRYKATLCVGPSAGNCRSYETKADFELSALTCEPVIPNHNVREADRINIIMVGVNFPDQAMYKNAIAQVLSVSGEPTFYPYSPDMEDPLGTLHWGLFSVPPFKSNLSKFNLWYLSSSVPADPDDNLGGQMPYPTITRDLEAQTDSEVDRSGQFVNQCNVQANHYFGVLYKGYTTVNAAGHRSPSPSEQTMLAADAVLPAAERHWVEGSSVTTVDAVDAGADNAQTFVHESAHALIYLGDEYTSCMGLSGDPGFELQQVNIAQSSADAMNKWGNLVGQLDPFYNTVRAANMLPSNKVLDGDKFEEFYPASNYTVASGVLLSDVMFFPPETDCILPTRDSLMNITNQPILGAVNRARTQAVLDMFTGN